MRNRWIGIAVVLVIACGNKSGGSAGGGDDCKVVTTDPGRAVAALSEKYPNDAVKVATIIEGCVAPTGTPCERIGRMVKAIPSMMPPGTASVADPEATCLAMPPEMQRCMLPSYTLAHNDECAAIRDGIAKAAVQEIKLDPKANEPACPDVRIEITERTVAIGRGTPKTINRVKGVIPAATLEKELAELATACAGAVAITAGDKETYQDVIAVMDLAKAAGFLKLGLQTSDSPPAPHAPPPTTPTTKTDPGDLKKAPVVTVTKTEVLINAKRIAGVGEDVTAAVTTALAAVATADPSVAAGPLVIQADSETGYATINQIIEGAKAAGFDDVLFAVKSK